MKSFSKLNSKTCSKYVNFKDLSEQSKKNLLSKLSPSENSLIITKQNLTFKFFLISISILWFGFLYFLTNNNLWKTELIVIYSLLSLVAVFILVTNLMEVIKWFLSKLKKKLIITQHFIIETNFNDIWYWNLAQLSNFEGSHKFVNGRYAKTDFVLFFERGIKKFTISDNQLSEIVLEKLNDFRKLFIEASAKNDFNLNKFEVELFELKGNKIISKPRLFKKLQPYISAIFSIISTFFIISFAINLNEFFDDKISWEKAKVENRAKSYRNYLQTHLNGRWRNTAQENLQQLYEKAEAKYRGSLNKGNDPDAVEVVIQALNFAKNTQNYQVKIEFEKHNEISPNIINELKKEFKISRLITLGDSFIEEKIKERESHLVSVISEAFYQVIQDDILEFTDTCENQCILFHIQYFIDSDTIYYDDRQEKLPENDRTWYPGVFFDWHFQVNIPDQTNKYGFELYSDPASHIRYDSKSTKDDVDKDEFAKVLENDKNNIYDSMVKSAFDDFRANLVYRMGIGEEPKKEKFEEKDNSKPKKAKDNKE